MMLRRLWADARRWVWHTLLRLVGDTAALRGREVGDGDTPLVSSYMLLKDNWLEA
jgi:hypothetical protein